MAKKELAGWKIWISSLLLYASMILLTEPWVTKQQGKSLPTGVGEDSTEGKKNHPDIISAMKLTIIITI